MKPYMIVGTAILVGLANVAFCQTETFVDRQHTSDLRMLTYNPYFDLIFPDVSAVDAAKFARIVAAVQPDIINLQEINRPASDVASLLNTIFPPPVGGSWNAHQGRDNVIASFYPIVDTRTRPTPPGQRDLAMARVDLPDATHDRDFYIMNNHYACCSGNDPARQQQSDALVNWMRDARHVGGSIDLPGNTPMAVLGDLNIVESPQPLLTLITGNIIDEATYGPDSAPDWDGTSLMDAHPLHNVAGPNDYTWRDDSSIFDPGRLDYVIYTDSVVDLAYGYVLNTREMTPAELAATGLQANDVVLDPSINRFDHLPLVTDFRLHTIEQIADLSGDGMLNSDDLADIQAAVAAGSDQLRYDLNGDRVVNSADVYFWVTDIYGTLLGDANLDFRVDGVDFLSWNANKFSSANWSSGDFNSDGLADGQDFVIWNQYKFQSAAVQRVPEPGGMIMICGALLQLGTQIARTGGAARAQNKKLPSGVPLAA